MRLTVCMCTTNCYTIQWPTLDPGLLPGGRTQPAPLPLVHTSKTCLEGPSLLCTDSTQKHPVHVKVLDCTEWKSEMDHMCVSGCMCVCGGGGCVHVCGMHEGVQISALYSYNLVY